MPIPERDTSPEHIAILDELEKQRREDPEIDMAIRVIETFGFERTEGFWWLSEVGRNSLDWFGEFKGIPIRLTVHHDNKYEFRIRDFKVSALLKFENKPYRVLTNRSVEANRALLLLALHSHLLEEAEWDRRLSIEYARASELKLEQARRLLES